MINIEKLVSELKDLPEDSIVLIETCADNVFQVALAAVKILTEKNDSGMVISASRPYANLLTNYKRNNIDTKKVFILDLLSKNHNADIVAENVMFMKNASSLTDISLSINDYLKKIEGKRFLFIDSINTMLIHNESMVFARFLHSILTRMRINGVGGLLISLTDKTNREVRAEIAQLCDKVIKIG
jgi:hypothetical protein